MLTHPTHDRLVALGLTGMAKALEEQRKQPDIAALSFEERIALMVDREAIERENKRLVSRLKFASLRQSAVVEDVDMKAPRGLDKTLFAGLVAGDWIAHSRARACARWPPNVPVLTSSRTRDPMKPSTGAAVRLHRNAVRDRPESLSAFKWNACPPSPEYPYSLKSRRRRPHGRFQPPC